MIKHAPIFSHPAFAELDEFFRPDHTPALALLCHGPSASNSSSTSNTKNYSTQTSVQGGSGTTLAAGRDVTYNDLSPQVAEDAFSAITETVNKALSQSTAVANQADELQTAQDQVQQQNNDAQNQLLANALLQEQSLAAYQGTGGGYQAVTQAGFDTKYLIWGAIAIGAIALLSIFRK